MTTIVASHAPSAAYVIPPEQSPKAQIVAYIDGIENMTGDQDLELTKQYLSAFLDRDKSRMDKIWNSMSRAQQIKTLTIVDRLSMNAGKDVCGGIHIRKLLGLLSDHIKSKNPGCDIMYDPELMQAIDAFEAEHGDRLNFTVNNHITPGCKTWPDFLKDAPTRLFVPMSDIYKPMSDIEPAPVKKNWLK